MSLIDSLSPNEKRRLLTSLLRSKLSKVIASPPLPGQKDFRRFEIQAAELRPEAVLDPSIKFSSASVVPELGFERVLLTGATGFLGSFLVNDLLSETDATIYCLVRCSNAKEGRKRIIGSLAHYLPNTRCETNRIIVVPGDLSEPLFGLSARCLEELVSATDAIYHNGADVNLLSTYPELRKANVLGTQEVLRFASLCGSKPVHYISTVAAYPLRDKSVGTLDESATEDDTGTLFGGYAHSKWVAEQLVKKAGTMGLPVSIYRPGIITGHSSSGAWKTNDMLCRMIKIAIERGTMPELTIDMTPVDYVSRAIIHISKQSQSVGGVYHLVNSKAVNTKDLASWIRSYGYPIRCISYKAWRLEMARVAANRRDTALGSLTPLFLRRAPDNHPKWMTALLAAGYQSAIEKIATIFEHYASQVLRLNCESTLSLLTGTSITCPVVDVNLLSIYLTYFVRIGYIKPPDHSTL